MYSYADTSQSAASEPVDWLGLSRLGSPDYVKSDIAPTKQTQNDGVPQPAVEISPAAATADDDDWLGVSKARRARQASPGRADDWLGGADVGSVGARKEKVDDWLMSATAKDADESEKPKKIQIGG